MSNGLPHQRRSTAKWIASFLTIFLLLLIACLLLLPMFFSTAGGKKYLLKMIQNRTGFQIEIQELSLSWFGTQQAKGVRGQQPKEQMDFTAEEISSSSPLWKIVWMNDLGQTQLISPELKISKAFQPTAHLPKKPAVKGASFALQTQYAAAKPLIAPPFKGKVIVNQGTVEFITPGLEPVAFDQIEASLDMTSEEEVALSLSCTTNPQGQIAIKGSASHLNAPYPSVVVQSTINQLPVRGIDQFTSLFYPELSGLVYSFLGPTINLGCNLSASAGNFDLRLNAVSPQLNAYVATQSLNGVLTLKSPAELNYNFTPQFLQKIAKLYPALADLALAQPALVQTTIEQFSCPIPSSLLDLKKSSFQASLTGPSQISLTVGGKPVSLGSLSGRFNTPGLEQKLTASLSSGLQTQNRTGSIEIEGDIEQPFNPAMQGTLSLNAAGFPIGLLAPSLTEILGPTVDLIAAGKLQPGNNNLHLSWQSDFLKVPAIDLSMGKALTLTSPAPFAFMLNPTYFNTLLPKEQIQLAKADPFQGVIQTFSFPLDGVKNTRLEASLKAGQLLFSGCYPLKIARMETQLSITTLNQIGLQMDGDPLKASLTFAYDPAAGILTLTKPLSAQYTLDQQTFNSLYPQGPALAKPALIQFSLDPFVLPVSNFDLYKLKLKGQLSNPELLLGPEGKRVSLKNTSVPFQWDSKTASLQISSQVQNPAGTNGNMEGECTLANLAAGFSSAKLLGSLELQNMSSLLLDTFSGECLSAIVGPTFSTKFKLQSTGLEKQMLGIKWTSPNLTIDSGFLIDNSSVQLQGSNNQISWTLTPEGYKALDQWIVGTKTGFIPFEIKEPSTFSISLSKLSLPLAVKQQEAQKAGSCNTASFSTRSVEFDLQKLQFYASARNPKLTFFDRSSHETIQLSNLAITLNKNDQNPVTLSLDSNVTAQGSNAAGAKNGSISLSGNLTQTMTPQGSFDVSKLTCSIDFKAQQLPSRALDIFARANGRTDLPFTTVFGNVINAAIHIDLDQFSGPVSLNINTPNTRADLNGIVTKGVLTLKEDAYFQMKITPEASRLVLKEVNPLNLSYLYSQAPVTLEIPSRGFSFPLYPVDLSKISIPNATIELGKILCRNEGNVHIALGLLKSKQFDKSNELMLWFAPIDLHVLQGIADIERTEVLLADTYDVCVWGNVNLVTDYVDMLLGLTAQTLKQAFGIKSLPDTYVLTLPMRGKADDVQIDTKKATTKVALLLAWQQAGNAGAFGKGPAGAIVGGLVNKMATLPDSNVKVPPAKHPFPWEIKEKTSHVEKKRQFKLNEKPLKQILKIIK